VDHVIGSESILEVIPMKYRLLGNSGLRVSGRNHSTTTRCLSLRAHRFPIAVKGQNHSSNACSQKMRSTWLIGPEKRRSRHLAAESASRKADHSSPTTISRETGL
jgi:hypothetical protein